MTTEKKVILRSERKILFGVIASIIFAVILFATNILPVRKNLPVPFTAQAPTGDWREPWQNACEETAILMVDNFYKGDQSTKQEAEQAILQIFSIKEQNFGSSKDESMERVVDLINAAHLTWQAQVVVNPTLQEIQQEIAAGRPVIAPVDASLLVNPNYVQGLRYHVMVISGYDNEKESFIVQDPGTERGKNFIYPFDSFMNAIHDYLKSDIQGGRKAVIFTIPPLTP